MKKGIRYLIFLVGLFLNSVGVSLATRANLGTSPISSLPYVASLCFAPSLGVFTVVLSIILVLLQIVILGRKFQIEHLLQLPISVLFGYFIDLTMKWLDFFDPQALPLQLAALLLSCAVLGFGVYLETIADVAMLPGESFVRAVCQRWGTDFGHTKIGFDCSITVSAGLCSLLFFGRLNGVGIGTILSALLVGWFVRRYRAIAQFFSAQAVQEEQQVI